MKMKVTFTVDKVSPTVDRDSLLIAVEQELMNFGHKTRTGLGCRLRRLVIDINDGEETAITEPLVNDERIL